MMRVDEILLIKMISTDRQTDRICLGEITINNITFPESERSCENNVNDSLSVKYDTRKLEVISWKTCHHRL